MEYTTEFIFSGIVSCVIIVVLTSIYSFHQSHFRYSVLGYVLCLLFILGEHLIEYSGYSYDFSFSIFLSSPFHFAMAPMLNRVLSSLFDYPVKRKQFLLELLPAAGVLLYMLPFYLLNGADKYQYLTNYISCECGMAPRHRLLIVILLLQMTAYSIYWRQMIHSYSRLVKSRTSSSSVEFISWVSRILTLIVLFVFSIIATGFARIYAGANFYKLDQLENIILSLTPHAFLMLLFFVNEKTFPSLSAPKLVKEDIKPITKEVNRADVDQLLALMQQEKLYLNPDLNLADVAERMQMTRHHVSDLMSQGVNKSFYDFVNEYRILHAKMLMKSDAIHTYSLEGVAQESGFNNYVSFYRVFKRFTGVTPSKYINAEMR